MIKQTPEVDTIAIPYNGRTLQLEYFYRAGYKETILLIGFGRAKEIFWEACEADSLSEHTLICFDNACNGNLTFYDDVSLSTDDLCELTYLFVRQLNLPRFVLTETGMGGLTTLFHLRTRIDRIKAYINIEKSLMLEDRIFLDKIVVDNNYEVFSRNFLKVNSDIKADNKSYPTPSNGLQQPVKYSSLNEFLQQFIAFTIPKIFIQRVTLQSPNTSRKEINAKSISSDSSHFIFYDNPKELYDVIGFFAESIKS